MISHFKILQRFYFQADWHSEVARNSRSFKAGLSLWHWTGLFYLLVNCESFFGIFLNLNECEISSRKIYSQSVSSYDRHGEENTRNLFRYIVQKKLQWTTLIFSTTHTQSSLSVWLSFFASDLGGYNDPEDNEEVVPASTESIGSRWASNWYRRIFPFSILYNDPICHFSNQIILQSYTFIAIPLLHRRSSCVCGDLSNHQPLRSYII